MIRNTLKKFLALLTCMMLLCSSASAMNVQSNIVALKSYRNLGTNNSALTKDLEKLSSGYRISRAGDDAAGLAISEEMRTEIEELNTEIDRIAASASWNAGDIKRTTFAGRVGIDSYMKGYLSQDNRMTAVLLTNTAGGYKLTQYTTDGTDGIIGSSNPHAFLVDGDGTIAAVGAGEGQVAIFKGNGQPVMAWNLSTDGETIEVEEAPELEILLGGKVVTELFLTTASADVTLEVRQKKAQSIPLVVAAVTGESLGDIVKSFEVYCAEPDDLDQPQSSDSGAADTAESIMEGGNNNLLIQAAQAMLKQVDYTPELSLDE